jgi:hypothetical protein
VRYLNVVAVQVALLIVSSVLVGTVASLPAKAAQNHPELSATFYGNSALAGWNPFDPARCENYFKEMKKDGIGSITFVFEHFGYDMNLISHHLDSIPASQIPQPALARCFQDALDLGMHVAIKVQLPDYNKGFMFVWRNYFTFDPLEYFSKLINPYVTALATATAAAKTDGIAPKDPAFYAGNSIYVIHELHVMLCEHTSDVQEILLKTRALAQTLGIPDLQVGMSLDFRFFTQTGEILLDIRGMCLKSKSLLAPVFSSHEVDFIGAGAYKPSGGKDGKIDNLAQGVSAMSGFLDDMQTTLNLYGFPEQKKISISEWNGGGSDPATWGNPDPKGYALALQGALEAIRDRNGISFGAFTFWNLRSTDAESIKVIDDAASLLKPFEN